MLNVGRARVVGCAVALGFIPSVIACGGSEPKTDAAHNAAVTPGPSTASASDSGTSTAADSGASADGWTTLLSGQWTMPPGTEGYVCVRQTVQEDLYVNGFDAINPLGTHHTLLTMGEPTAPDGLTACSAAENRPLGVFGSGVGTNPIEFPKGVGLKIAKGTQLLLNLHLFNSGTEDLSGTSGTRVRVLPESDVGEIAEGILAGTITLDIPPQQTTTHTGYCTMSSDVTLFAVAPHMHKLGIYEKVVAERASGPEVSLFDAAYDFNDQSYSLIDPLKLAKGDRVRIECTHRNTTDATVTFGESTLSEMCFAGLYRYPADGSLFVCVDAPVPTVPPTP